MKLEMLKRFTNIPTSSFFEHFVNAEIKKVYSEELKGKNVELIEDECENVILHYKGSPDRNKPLSLGFAVHTDHPAFHLYKIEGQPNLLYAVMMGGLNENLVVGTVLNIFHESSDQPLGQATILQPLKDRGTYLLRSEQVFEKVSFGTFVLDELSEKDGLISAPVLDDLAGLSMSLEAFIEIVNQKLPVDVFFIAHRAEEVGFYGAYGLANSDILPKDIFVLAVDTSSYKVPFLVGKNVAYHTIAELGEGIVIRTGDASTEEYNSEALFLLMMAAETFKGKVREIALTGGTCEGTMYYSMDYRAAAIGLPIKSMHNDGQPEGKYDFVQEAIHWDDYSSGIKFLVHSAKTLSEQPELYERKDENIIYEHQAKYVEQVGQSFDYYRENGII